MSKLGRDQGFTLIELMVVVTIIIILSGMSLAAYFQFTQRQAAQNDSRSLVTILRRAQSLAKNLVYPIGCSGLTGYQLSSDGSGQNAKTMSAVAVCTTGGNIPAFTGEPVLAKSYFPSQVTVTFAAGTGKIITNNYTITPTNSDTSPYTVKVTMDVNGNINAE